MFKRVGEVARSVAASPRTRRGAGRLVAALYFAGVLVALGAIAAQWGSTSRVDRFSDLVDVPEDPARPRDDEKTVELRMSLTDFAADTGELQMTLEASEIFNDHLPREDIVLGGSIGSLRFPFVSDDPDDLEWQPRQLTLGMFGTPRKYPQDSYRYDISVRVLEPGGLAVRTHMHASGQVLLEYDVHTELTPLDVFPDPEVMEDTETFELALTRPTSLVVFTYAMALSPTLLLVGIVVQYLRTAGAAVFTAEAALTVLTLLPLRQVLVPEGLRAPTRVDLILATELALFIAVAGYVTLGSRAVTRSQREAGPTPQLPDQGRVTPV